MWHVRGVTVLGIWQRFATKWAIWRLCRIDLLYAHLDVSFIFNHLDAMNGDPNFSSVTPPRKKGGL
jgi:hypothetical protein